VDTEGHYRLDVFAHLLSDAKPIRLFSQALEISRDVANALEEKDAGLYFAGGRMHHVIFRTLRSGNPPLTRKSFCGSWAKPRAGDFPESPIYMPRRQSCADWEKH
jgi:hypothetical protein